MVRNGYRKAYVLLIGRVPVATVPSAPNPSLEFELLLCGDATLLAGFLLQYSKSVLSDFFQRFFSHRFSNFCRKIILKTGTGR